MLPAQAGGKMVELDANFIFLAIGDFERSDLVDDIGSNHGKVVKIDINNKSYEIYSKGLRNPQGLYFNKNTNSLIETEHGPMGGDEINLILKDKDYGWPNVTYGIDYGANKIYWSLGNNGGAKYGRHEGYEKPIFSFIPSIGIKSIEMMPFENPEFSIWGGNYLFCSSRGIYRAMLSEDQSRLIAYEIIKKKVCRDIAISPTGKIITNELNVIIRDKDYKARH